jgi:hypothetical protein
MVATGLSESPQAYEAKLLQQTDEQIDAWAIGSLRDIAKRKGVAIAVHEFGHATSLSDNHLAAAYTLGGGPAATMGRSVDGRLIFPAVALWALVPGLHQFDAAHAKAKLVAFLVATFEEVVYI